MSKSEKSRYLILGGLALSATGCNASEVCVYGGLPALGLIALGFFLNFYNKTYKNDPQVKAYREYQKRKRRAEKAVRNLETASKESAIKAKKIDTEVTNLLIENALPEPPAENETRSSWIARMFQERELKLPAKERRLRQAEEDAIHDSNTMKKGAEEIKNKIKNGGPL